MRNFIFLLLPLLLFNKTNAQVFTRHLTEEQRLEDFINFTFEKEIPYYKQPEINFEKVLEEDRQKGYPLHRVAVRVAQNYSVEDGFWTQYGNIMVWQIGFSAPRAKSLNFLMNELVLPIDSELYVLSKSGDMIHGPVTRDVVYDNIYSTDIIESNEVLILVKTDLSHMNGFNIIVNSVCQGIPRNFSLRSWQEAEDCNFDVNCAIGNGWENERDGVALVLKNGEDHCSGSLINNQCQDMRPFFLTAFHCLDSDLSGQLSAGEQNLSIYTFRFRFEAGTPMCPGNSTGTQGVWITYSGAAFRAANAASDFALIELNGTIINQPNIAVAGWNRENIAPTSTTLIHHPIGDAKKITIDNNLAQQQVWSGANCWFIQTDLGSTQGGSSGSPYFDQNRRIIGQHFGTNQGNLAICDRTNRFGGRFDLSWIGGGTNETRLSNWLGGINPPLVMNSIRSPWVNSNNSNFVCTTNKQFTLTNPIPGRTVTWTVSNTYLFATSGGASTSGSGTTSTLRAASSNSSGSAVITFTLTQVGCNPVVVTQPIWVGKPGSPSTNPSGYPTIQMGLGTFLNVHVISNPGAPSNAGTWTVTGSLTRTGINPNSVMQFEATSLGTGNFYVQTSNVCGVSPNGGGTVNVTSGGGGGPLRVQNVPNPASQSFVCILPEEYLENSSIKHRIKVIDNRGCEIFSDDFVGNKKVINSETWFGGMYFTKIYTNTGVFWGKVIITK